LRRATRGRFTAEDPADGAVVQVRRHPLASVATAMCAGLGGRNPHGIRHRTERPGEDVMRFRDRGDAASRLAQRMRAYKGRRPLVLGVPRGGVPMARAITGSSMRAAIRAVRAARPQTIVVAIGVAPKDSLARIAAAADEVVCLETPPDFVPVGQFFDDFSEVTDDMAVSALTRPVPAGTGQRAQARQ
jgi:hypothetical protein